MIAYTLWLVKDMAIQQCIHIRVTLATLLLLDQFELVLKDCWLNRRVSVQVHANVFQRELNLPGCWKWHFFIAGRTQLVRIHILFSEAERTNRKPYH